MKKVVTVFMTLILLCGSVFAQEIEINVSDNATESEIIAEIENEIEMQVVASKVAKRIEDTSADVTVITKEELAANAGGSVTDVLRANGILAIDGSSSRKTGDSIYVQGMSSDKLLIIIDGQRVRDGSMFGITALKRLPLSSIERIEIIKGPSSFLWGSDAMAGVIYIETKKGSETAGLHGSAGTSYKNNFYFDDNNHFAQAHFNLNYGFENGDSVWVGSSAEYGNTWLSPYSIIKLLDNEYKVINVRDDFVSFDVFGGTKLSFNDIHNIEFTARYQQEYSPVSDTSSQDNDFKKIMGNINYNVFALDNLDLSISTGVSYDSEERISHSQNLNDYYIFNNNELLAVWYLNDIFTVKGGYGYDLELYNEVYNSNKIFNQQTHAVFAGGDAAFGTDVPVDLTAGVRYQSTLRDVSGFTNTDTLHSVSPELGAVVKPLDWLGVKAHVGHSFKVPELTTAFRDYFDHTWFYVAPNPDVMPESGWGYSGSVEFYPFENMTFSLGAFRNDLRNLITYVDNGKKYEGKSVQEPTNIDKVYTWGIDGGTTASFNLATAGVLDYGFNYEVLWARQVLESTEQYRDIETGEKFNPRLDRPQYTLSGNVSWTKDDWGTSAKLSGFYFAQGFEYEEVEKEGVIYHRELRTPAYTSIDLRLSQELLSFFTETLNGNFYFEVTNLFNSKYDTDDDGDTDRPERQFVIGFSMDF